MKKRRKWTLWSVLCLTGAPWMVILTIAGIYIKACYIDKYTRGAPFEIRTFDDIKDVVTYAGLAVFIIFMRNLMWLKSDRPIGLLTWIDKYQYEPPSESSRKRKAQYPDVPDELLSDEPDGLVLGCVKEKYLRVALKRGNILNSIIIGSTGCGKSVLILSMLLFQLHHEPKTGESFEPMVFFALDIKPELAKKSVKIAGNKGVHVMNPLDRSSYGWDVYYRLTTDSTDDEIFSEMDLISRALIDAGKSDKNEFFYQSGRNITTGILFYTYKIGRSFVQGIDYLLDGDLATVVKKTLEKVAEKPEFRMVRTLLYPYADKSGEAFQGIELAVRESMAIFVRQNVKFFFDGNPRKASPLDLEKKITIFFSIHENLLEEYKTILRLTTMQVMEHCKERPENAHMLTLIIDEAARLGAINWTDFLATSRSHQISTILAFQGISQMQKVWGKEDAKTLIELCRVIAVLSCTDPDMARILSDWVGDYKEEKRSVNEGSKSGGSYSMSYEDKKILTQADIMNLQDMGEVLLFIKGKYYRTNVTQARYYAIPELNEISTQCLDFNDQGGNKK